MLKAFKTLDGFKSSFQMGVKGFNQVGCSGNPFLLHIAGKKRQSSLNIGQNARADRIVSKVICQFRPHLNKFRSGSPLLKQQLNLYHKRLKSLISPYPGEYSELPLCSGCDKAE